MKRRRKMLSIFIIFFFRISININIFTSIVVNVSKNSDIFNVEVNLSIETYNLSEK